MSMVNPEALEEEEVAVITIVDPTAVTENLGRVAVNH
jgi:hypothetical protein